MPPSTLHLIAGSGSATALEAAKARLAAGDDPNVREEDGLTPLHVAAHWDNLAMVQLLLLHGADVWAEDGEGRTPMGMAAGRTKIFLDRMHNRSEGERLSLLGRMAALHLGTRIGRVFKGARKRMRRTLGSIMPGGQRRRAESELNNPAVIATSTPRPSLSTGRLPSAAAAAPRGRSCSTYSAPTADSSSQAAAAAAASGSYYCTADEGEEETRRSNLDVPSRGGSGSGLLILQWKRPLTPPRVEDGPGLQGAESGGSTAEIGWRSGVVGGEKEKGEKEEEKSRGDEKVTVRKKQQQKTPAKKKVAVAEKDRDYRPSASDSEADEAAAGEGGESAKKKPRTPRGLRKRVEEMSEERLRSELIALGIAAGPIGVGGGGGVRRGYERKLIEGLMTDGDEGRIRRILDGGAPPAKTPLTARSAKTATTTSSSSSSARTPAAVTTSSTTSAAAAVMRKTPGGGDGGGGGILGQKYSRPLELAIAGKSWHEGEAQGYDEKIRSIFLNRGVSAFCYLLMDPRALPEGRMHELRLAEMIDAIFYVGKGTKARPHHHLIDAKSARAAGAAAGGGGGVMTRKKAKIGRICDIWDAGKGVVSVQMTLDICDEEALTREASMIDAVGLHNLTNEKAGTYYGTTTHWLPMQKAQLGTLMLKRVYKNLRSDPSCGKQIRPEMLPDSYFKGGPAARKTPTAATAAAAGAASRPTPPPPGLQNRLRNNP